MREVPLGWRFWRLPNVTTKSPPHPSAALTASPRGEACVTFGDTTAVFFLGSVQGLPNAFPWGGRWAGEAGSDEGGPLGFLIVGSRHAPLSCVADFPAADGGKQNPIIFSPAPPGKKFFSARECQLRWRGSGCIPQILEPSAAGPKFYASKLMIVFLGACLTSSSSVSS